MGDQVRAVDIYADNGHLIAAAARLGHLRSDWVTLDASYGSGVFWRVFRPAQLIACDIEPKSDYVIRADFRDLPFENDRFDAAVIDGPYGLRGTVHADNGGYGLDAGYMSVEARHELLRAGLAECARVTRPGGRVLAKCQAQVCSGRVWWQDRMLADHGESKCGLVLVERLDMLGGGRPQPVRSRRDGKPSLQQHAYGRPSTLLIFRKVC